MQSAEFLDEPASRAQLQVERVAENQPITDRRHFVGKHRFHGAARADRHETGGLDLDPAQPQNPARAWLTGSLCRTLKIGITI